MGNNNGNQSNRGQDPNDISNTEQDSELNSSDTGELGGEARKPNIDSADYDIYEDDASEVGNGANERD